MSTQCVSTDEIIDAYRAAIEHANGNVFASMVQVSFADGWFKVRDLEGTESRYRKKEIVSLTHNLLQQPEFEPGNALEFVAAMKAPAPQTTVPAFQKEEHPAAPVQARQFSEPLRMAEKADEEVFLQPMEQPRSHQEPILTEVLSMKQVSGSYEKERFNTAEPTIPTRVPVEESSRIIELNKSTPAQPLDRQLENKTYFRNLGKILAIVAAVFGLLIGWMLLKGN
jgi:hypothetical protein